MPLQGSCNSLNRNPGRRSKTRLPLGWYPYPLRGKDDGNPEKIMGRQPIHGGLPAKNLLRVTDSIPTSGTASRTTGMVGINPRGSWEIPEISNFSELDRSEKARCHVPISAGLAPVGSQLASYNERTSLSRSPLGLPRWKQRLTSYSAGARRSNPIVHSKRPNIID